MKSHLLQSVRFRVAAIGVAGVCATATADSLLEANTKLDSGPQNASAPAPADAAAAQAAPPAAMTGEKGSYLFGNQLMHGDPTILWGGFLSGLRGFSHFYEPVGNPIYFESPFNYSGLRLLYLHHDFPNGSQIGGGDANIYAAQVRLALTERLGFIATKDGYTDMNAGIIPEDGGWNDFAIGAKYAFWVDREADWVMTGGMRWEWGNGDREILQGGTQELSPFVSFAKGWDQFHLLGNVTGRIPLDPDAGNCILSWDLHADYEIAPEALPGFAPMFEVHGLHYLSNGDMLPLSIGGLDYNNIGSSDVAGDGVVWGGVGFRWKFSPHMSVGSTFEFPFSHADDDIMGNRVTVDVALTW